MSAARVARSVTPTRAVYAATAVVALVVFLAWPLPSNAATTAVNITDFAFTANSVTINVGDTVTWSDNGFAPHSVTADDLSFDSSPSCPGTCLANGSTFSHTFNTPGTFVYHCRIHGSVGGLGMSGTVIVNGPGPTTTTTAAPTTTVAPTTTTAVTTTITDPATTTTTAVAAATAPQAVSAVIAFTG